MINLPNKLGVLKKKEANSKTKTLTDTKNWYQDRYQKVSVQRNALFLITTLALIGLGFSVTAVATLNNSKIFEPFIVEIEDKSGIVTKVNQKSIVNYTADEAVIRALLAQYIRARESYDVGTYEYFYGKEVRVFSSASVYNVFQKLISQNNESSPVHLSRAGMREVAIKSIAFLESKKAQIRLSVTEYKMPDKVSQWKEHYIATVNFDFLNLDLSIDERYINPLGFQILDYRLDKETVQ